jgi:uncharacterized membrane protein YidH (DUF202 family)
MTTLPPDDQLWDPGVQNERTALAWQRTLLSGLACALLVARLLATVWLPLAISVGVAALASSAVLSGVVISRYRANHRALVSEHRLPDAKTPFLVAVLVSLTAIGAIGYVVLASQS